MRIKGALVGVAVFALTLTLCGPAAAASAKKSKAKKKPVAEQAATEAYCPPIDGDAVLAGKGRILDRLMEKRESTTRGEGFANEGDREGEGWNKWFYGQRKYPATTLPPDAIGKALRAAKENNKPGQRSGSATLQRRALAAASWVPLGPSQIPGGETDTTHGGGPNPFAAGTMGERPRLGHRRRPDRSQCRLLRRRAGRRVEDDQCARRQPDLDPDQRLRGIAGDRRHLDRSRRSQHHLRRHGRGERLLRFLLRAGHPPLRRRRGHLDSPRRRRVLHEPGDLAHRDRPRQRRLDHVHHALGLPRCSPSTLRGPRTATSRRAASTARSSAQPTAARRGSLRTFRRVAPARLASTTWGSTSPIPTFFTSPCAAFRRPPAASGAPTTPRRRRRTSTRSTPSSPRSTSPIRRCGGSRSASATSAPSTPLSAPSGRVSGASTSPPTAGPTGPTSTPATTAGGRSWGRRSTRQNGPPFTASMVTHRIVLDNRFSRTVIAVANGNTLTISGAPLTTKSTEMGWSVGSYPLYCGGQCFYDMTVVSTRRFDREHGLRGWQPADLQPRHVRRAGRPLQLAHARRRVDLARGLAGKQLHERSPHGRPRRRVRPQRDPSRVYDGNDGGVWSSDDQGASWKNLYEHEHRNHAVPGRRPHRGVTRHECSAAHRTTAPTS